MNLPYDEPEALWTARPWAARAIRSFVFVAPLALSVAAAWGISAAAPKVDSFLLGLGRWVVIAALSTVVLIGVDRLVRRLLPLATLYGLTLAFPDAAPSRYQMALRKGSTTQLRVRIAEARSGKLGDTPAEAAERVLELVMALSVHDRLTRGHSERVRALTQMIGEEMGLTDRELDRMRWAGLLHDVGKLMISSDILNKPGRLTDEEFETIKLHPEFGRKLVAPIADWLGDAARAVWEHHERWDGNGYPRGLATTDISLAGRIVSVADAYDVMTSVRSYKKSTTPAAARAELARCSGTQFDPVVVRAFLNVSLGRLRRSLGPLSWLAQLPLLPGAFAAGATQATATAATAIVGAAAASTGLGLAGEPVLPVPDAVAAESFALVDALDAPVTIDTEPPVTVIFAPTSGSGIAEPSATGESQAGGVGDPATQSPAATTTTTLSDPISTTTSTTVADVATSTSTVPAVATPAPTTTVAPPTPVTTAVTAATTTSVAATATTVAATTTTATTTVAPPAAQRPGWLPPAGVPTPLYLGLGGRIDLSDLPLLDLARSAPTRNNVRSLDPDRDGLAGLTIPRLDSEAFQWEREVAHVWGGPDQFRLAGEASALVHVGAPGATAVDLTVRARVLVCGAGGFDASCTAIASQTLGVNAAADPVPIVFGFGSIDAIVPAGGTVRLVLDVPAGSAADVVLFADTRPTPSALTVVFA